jgi:hypothetical protein
MQTLAFGADERPEVTALLANLKTALPSLNELLAKCSGEWGYEDPFYRFYHQSFKVYALQQATEQIVAALQSLAPDRQLNPWFSQIVADGTGKKFEREHNARWPEVTRPILEAFSHARFFLEMAVVYGQQLSMAPQLLPSGWAAFLYLYGLR